MEGTLLALIAALGAVGCHPIPQAYSGRDAIGPFPAEERGVLPGQEQYAARGDRSGSRHQGETAPLGHVKPVGYTTKNFGDMEKTDSVPPPTTGTVQWSDAPMQVGQSNEPGTAGDTSPQVQDLEACDVAAAGQPLTDDDAVFINELSGEAPKETEPLSKPIKTALADSIEHPRQRSTADISFLPETAERALPEPTDNADWRVPTQQAISLLQDEIDRRVRNGEICAAEEARLRLLLLTTGNIPGAAEKIAGMDPNLQLFWERECRGLGRFIETQETRVAGTGEKTAWMETLPDFQEGVTALKTGMPLMIRKSLFVKEPSVFGYYEEVPSSFAPGETVNAYFELDNVVCRKTEEGTGCDIAVLCRRELTDSLDRTVVETKEKLCAGHSASPLNDIVLNLSVHLPEQLPPGTYKLKTVFLDRHSTLSQPVAKSMEIRVD